MMNKKHHKARVYEGKIFTMPSMAIPDQTMSMRTIMNRYAQGLPVMATQNPIYDTDGTSEGVNMKTLDLVDLQELGKKNKELLNNFKKGQEIRRKSEEKQKQEEEIARRVKEAIASSQQ